MDHHPSSRFRGPRSWAALTVLGALFGAALGALAPFPVQPAGHGPIAVPVFLIAPFALLLLAIALMPFVHARLWHERFPEASLFLGALVAGALIAALGKPGLHAVEHAAVEYYQFIALLFGLYTVSGAIVINVEARGRPLVNTALLGAGAVLANIVGTTGASMLLIRPFMRVNEGRLRPFHIVFFIFLVSNCGGCLTPIGDPPLYIGFLRGVPFFWTLMHLWKEWAFVCGTLLVVFYLFDRRVKAHTLPTIEAPPAASIGASISAGPGAVVDVSRRVGFPIGVHGRAGLIALPLVVAAVFLDPFLASRGVRWAVPVGPLLQIGIGVLVYRAADRSLYEQNRFSFFPIKEVGFLFVGIFLTMVPALAYLAQHGPSLGLETPTQFYFLTGSLSAALDNAPTYLTFLQTALANHHMPMDPHSVRAFASTAFTIDAGTAEEQVVRGATLLAAISLGAVFFGAMTYIGNGPNFMVKSIAESAGVRMPSFLGFLKYSFLILLPVLVLAWALFIRGG